jgi:flagellar protein FliO/FliZ
LQQKLAILLLFIILYYPSGQFVQAEENKTVKDVLEEQKKDSKTEVDRKQQDEQKSEPILPIENQLNFVDYIKMLFSLLFVIALIYVLLRFINKRSRLFGQAQMLDNLGGIPLGANRSVQLIKVGERILVLGVGESIQLLKELEGREEIELLSLQRENEIKLQPYSLDKWFRKKAEKGLSENQFHSLLKSQLDTFAEGRKKAYERMAKKEDKE